MTHGIIHHIPIHWHQLDKFNFHTVLHATLFLRGFGLDRGLIGHARTAHKTVHRRGMVQGQSHGHAQCAWTWSWTWAWTERPGLLLGIVTWTHDVLSMRGGSLFTA